MLLASDPARRRLVATGVLTLLATGSAAVPAPANASAGRAAQGRSAAAPLRTAVMDAAVGPLVLDRVTVIDVEHGRRLPDQRVVIVGSRIRALGTRTAVAVPPGARLIDARGKYLIPGMWDMHTHVAGAGEVPGSWEGVGHQVKAVFYQLVANGITGIRDAGSVVPLDTFRVWKREIAAGRRVGPRLVVSGPYVVDTSSDAMEVKECNRAHFDLHPWQTCVTDTADARRLVDSLHAAGADMVKLYRLTVANYFAMAAEARRLGMPFGGHVENAQLDGLILSDSGARILDHWPWVNVCGGLASNVKPGASWLSYTGDPLMSLTQCTAAATQLRRNNTWVAEARAGWPVTFTDAMEKLLYDAMRGAGPANGAEHRGRWRPLSAAERRRLPSGADLAEAFGDSARHGISCERSLLTYAADLPVVPGMDWPMIRPAVLGAGVHVSMLSPVLCGVSPLWALQTATLNPARALGAADSLGTVAAGKVADLVLLEGDPLADIWNVSKIAGVVANGRYFDRAALDRMLRQAAAEWGDVETSEAALRPRVAPAP